MADLLVERDHLVDDLSRALAHGGAGLNDVPILLRKVLETEAWRERYDRRSRQVVGFASFREFAAAPPTEGLGSDLALIERIVGTDDPDLLRLLRRARALGQGRRTDLEPAVESTGSRGVSHTDYISDRLARDHPNEYAAVKRGELSLHRAAVQVGIRPPRISVRTDDPASIARSLRRNMSPTAIAELVRELQRVRTSDDVARPS